MSHHPQVLPVIFGGTNGTSASTARSALSAAASGNNTDITQLNGLMFPYERILGVATGIDATSTGTIALYTCPASTIAVVTKVIVLVEAMSGFSVAGIGDIGVSSGDIVPSTTFTGLDDATKNFQLVTSGIVHTVVATEVVNLNLTTAFTATSCVLAVAVLGFEVPA